MRIAILAVGSLGDVMPYVALGKGLRERGYDVRLASHEAFRAMARGRGLEFSVVEGNPMDIVRGEKGQAWLGSMDNPILFLYRTLKIARGILVKLTADAWKACTGCDALIYGLPLAGSGYTIAEGLGVPGIPASLYPLHPTREFPSIITPSLPFRGTIVNRASGFCAAQIVWGIYRSHLNRWRRENLGLGPLPRLAPFSQFDREGLPYLYGYSPSVIPTPAEWSASRVVSGYWFLDRPREWEPPRELLDFLNAGRAPFYIGFGSMGGALGERLMPTVLEALRASGERAIIASGWGGLGGASLPDTTFAVDSVPHDWLFPRVAAAVHHGGVGTTAAAIRAGIPSIVIPFFADQFFWGKRVFELGLGPRPMPMKDLTADGLRRAMGEVRLDRRMREACSAMARKIDAEDGVGRTADAVDRYLRSATRLTIQRRNLPGTNGATLEKSRESHPTV